MLSDSAVCSVRRRLAGAVGVALVLGAAVPSPAAAHHGDRLVFRPPVDAPVADPFRAPDGPYGPGNRGIEYGTGPGRAVRAAAAGKVTFAGPVAGSLHVTVDHGGGLISSYSYLGRIGVREGGRVDQGDPVGTTGERSLHFSVRIDGEYVDPARFIGIRRVRVRLVPLRR